MGLTWFGWLVIIISLMNLLSLAGKFYRFSIQEVEFILGGAVSVAMVAGYLFVGTGHLH